MQGSVNKRLDEELIVLWIVNYVIFWGHFNMFGRKVIAALLMESDGKKTIQILNSKKNIIKQQDIVFLVL